ncbi:MAG: hypothetical protein EB127_20025 [Alphaproteobacteria bacterium]|nr:hypothetical protein [Alphaproteobacteria bacterium]
MPTFNPDKREIDPRAFHLYRIQHTKTKLYWSGKGFDEKKKEKSILIDFRLLATLKWEHIYIKEELIIKDRRDDSTWEHLVPKLSAC